MVNRPVAEVLAVRGLGRAPLRVQLVLPVLVMTLPVFAVAMWHLLADRERDRQTALDQVQALVDGVAERLQSEMSGHALVLSRIAAQPRVRSMNPADCEPLIDDYLRLHPEVVTIGVRDMQGNPVCTFRTDPPAREQMLDFPWFENSLQAGAFHVGDAFSRRWPSAG